MVLIFIFAVINKVMIYLKKRTSFIVLGAMAISAAVTVFLVCFAALGSLYADAGCILDIRKDFTSEHPVILHKDRDEFILPNIENGIQFASGEKIRLVCPGKSNHLAINNLKQTDATCISNTTFNIEDKITGTKKFFELECSEHPKHIARKTGNKCSTYFTEIQIGVETNRSFIPLITVCFDETKKDSLYSVYNLTSKIGSAQISVPRPNDFDEKGFYDDLYPRPSTLYTRKSQRTGFTRILDSAQLAEKYISLTSDFFLSRGHLTAKGDFIYGWQQRATFFYVNVAPQWQTFNGYNWNVLEQNCRSFASHRKLDLIVYTGVFGSASLPNVNNVPRNLTLYADTKGKRAITVPEVYWKVLHDPARKTGIAFVGHNNPYEKDVAMRTICRDICDRVGWLSWDAKNITLGFSYCCDYRELKTVVSFMPDIEILNVLT